MLNTWLANAIDTILQDPRELALLAVCLFAAYVAAGWWEQRGSGEPRSGLGGSVRAWAPAVVWLGFAQYRRESDDSFGVRFAGLPDEVQVLGSVLSLVLWLSIYGLAIWVAKRLAALGGPRRAAAAFPRIGWATLVNAGVGFLVECVAFVGLGIWTVEGARAGAESGEVAFDGTVGSLLWLIPVRLVSGFAFFSTHYGLVAGTPRLGVGRAAAATLWLLAVSNLWRPLGPHGEVGLLLILLATLASLFVRGRPLTQDGPHVD